MNDLFEFDVAKASPEFIALRDESRNAQMKKLAQEMWQKFSAWADPNFPEQFSQHVHPRFWEMYLGVHLLENNFQLVPKKSSDGPDFHILLDGKNLWIEATAPESGSGNDAVPSIFEHDRFQQVPEDKIILRFTNAILEKWKKREQYIRTGIVDANDAFVIALNCGGIQMTLFEGPMPNIIKAVYPTGDYSITIDVNTLKPVREGYQVRHEISKLSGFPVRTDAFLDPIYSGVSGILYSNAAIWDIPTIAGCEFLYIDNSIANIHLGHEWLGIGKYCYREENHLRVLVLSNCGQL
jgi:hypothetical protein